MTRVVLNGEPHELAEPVVDAALVALGLDQRPKGIAVAVNGSVLPRADWASAALRDGDEVEILTAVQGG